MHFVKVFMSDQEKEKPELIYHRKRDVRICNRIKVVLLRSKNRAFRQIAQALRVHEEAVRNHQFFVSVKAFRTAGKDFCKVKAPKMKEALKSKITDNFQIIKNPVS